MRLIGGGGGGRCTIVVASKRDAQNVRVSTSTHAFVFSFSTLTAFGSAVAAGAIGAEKKWEIASRFRGTKGTVYDAKKRPRNASRQARVVCVAYRVPVPTTMCYVRVFFVCNKHRRLQRC